MENILEKIKLIPGKNIDYQEYRDALDVFKKKLCFPDPELCL